jgi:hypothetical protein
MASLQSVGAGAPGSTHGGAGPPHLLAEAGVVMFLATIGPVEKGVGR